VPTTVKASLVIFWCSSMVDDVDVVARQLGLGG
jgi:hypothetical protein